MTKNRLEAFSDGVIAVIITIMVLELKPPHGAELSELFTVLPTFLTYILSFVFIGIYWVNHHHFFHAVKKISGGLLWANLHLLFWLSLVPFSTAWMGENHFQPMPVLVYAINLWACGFAYLIAAQFAKKLHGPESDLSKAISKDKKGLASMVLYTISVILAPWYPMLSCALFVLVSLMWLIPDRRMEKNSG